MAKEKLLLINLNEEKTKNIGEIISSDTSRKILDHLAEKDDTEQNIAQQLGFPISTVHYHLQKLLEVQLVVVEEFHYSKKGREVNHYKIANKYIIITPKKISGIKQALKNILPVALVTLGIGVVIKFVQSGLFFGTSGVRTLAAEKAVPLMEGAVLQSAPATGFVAERTVEVVPDMALWFLIGGFTVIVIYLLITLVKGWWKK